MQFPVYLHHCTSSKSICFLFNSIIIATASVSYSPISPYMFPVHLFYLCNSICFMFTCIQGGCLRISIYELQCTVYNNCTDEISIFRCDSDKNSLVIIYICFKMHFLKYVGIIILFYSILFMWTRCGYQMFLSAPPPCPS